MNKISTGEKFFPLAGQEQLNQEQYQSTKEEKWPWGTSIAVIAFLSLAGWTSLAFLIF